MEGQYPKRGVAAELPSDDEFWSSPFGVSLAFFDVMVREAYRQKVGYHMWLFYYRHFVKHLIGQICKVPRSHAQDTEFPFVEDLMIYHVLSLASSQVELAINGIGRNKKIDDCEKPNLAFENGHIPKSALKCYVEAIKAILESKCVSDRVKIDRLSGYLHLIKNLGNAHSGANLTKAAAIGLEELVGTTSAPKSGMQYYTAVDHVLRYDIERLFPQFA